MPGSMVEFVTPIVKATRNAGKDVKVFYTLPQYEAWKEQSAGEKVRLLSHPTHTCIRPLVLLSILPFPAQPLTSLSLSLS